MDSGITPVMPMGNGFGSDSGIWLFALLILFGMGGNGFWGGNGGNTNAIQADINRGFDNQNLQAQTRDVLAAVTAGTAQSVATTNQVYHDTVSALNDKYSELARDIYALNVGQANALANQNACCCQTNRNIDSVKFENAQNTALINANMVAQTQKILDTLAQNKIDALQSKVSQLELAQAMQGVVRYPNIFAYNAGTNPFCGTTTTPSTGA